MALKQLENGDKRYANLREIEWLKEELECPGRDKGKMRQASLIPSYLCTWLILRSCPSCPKGLYMRAKRRRKKRATEMAQGTLFCVKDSCFQLKGFFPTAVSCVLKSSPCFVFLSKKIIEK